MTNRTGLTQNELKALAYFAVGVTSEGSIGGRDVSYRLSFAGNVGRDGLMEPAGNSGYSFGTLQIDLGQHPNVAPKLLEAYQAWAARQPDHASLKLSASEYTATLTALQRNGHAMEDDHAHDIDRSRLNRFLATGTGQNFVHALDTQHIAGVTAADATARNGDSALERLQRTSLYQQASDADQARLASMFMKLQNQSSNLYVPRLLSRVTSGEYSSAADVKAGIDGLMRNGRNGSPDFIESGADNTLRGTALFNSLRADATTNPLSEAWHTVVANPLIGPVGAHAAAGDRTLGLKYDTIRSLFLTPEASQRLVHALDQGTTLAEGDPALHHGRRYAGFYSDGANFVHWNANGQGVACIGGQWRGVDPDHLHRAVQRDGSVDLTLTENGRTTTLLHVDAHARTRNPANREPATAADAVPRPAHPAHPLHSDRPQHDSPDTTRRHDIPSPHAYGVHAAQAALAHLGYTGMDGKLVRVDGAVGQDSRHATEQFQRDHGLPVTGQFDERTQLRLAAADRTMASSTHPAHALYRQSLDAVRDLDRRMGIPGGQHSVALAGVAAAEAARAGLKRVDRVELGKDGVHAQAVEFRQGVDFWATNHTSAPIDVSRAITQPLAQSSERAAQAMTSQASANEQVARQQAPMRAPVL